MRAGRLRVRGGVSRKAWNLTFSAADEDGGCEPAEASPPAALRHAQQRGPPRPRRRGPLLPSPRNLGGRGPEAGAPGDVTARAGSALWRRGRLPSRVSAAAAAAAQQRNVGERGALRRGARGGCGGAAGRRGGRAAGRAFPAVLEVRFLLRACWSPERLSGFGAESKVLSVRRGFGCLLV